jgi:hypothetical protein
MRIQALLYLITMLFISCKSHTGVEHDDGAGGQVSAGSCRIEATVVQILPVNSTDTADICFKSPCDAVVHVERIMHCGSAATITPDEEGKITVHFVHSLNGSTVGGNVTGNVPLKVGTVFTAEIETRLAPGDKTNYLIYNYLVR